MQELAKRAVACKGWRWMPGMLTTHDARILAYLGTDGGSDVYAFASGSVIIGTVDYGELPDLTDPATLGCLLALVREAWDAPALQVSPRIDREYAITGWTCYLNRRVDGWCTHDRYDGNTEAEAIIAALAAAPNSTPGV